MNFGGRLFYCVSNPSRGNATASTHVVTNVDFASQYPVH